MFERKDLGVQAGEAVGHAILRLILSGVVERANAAPLLEGLFVQFVEHLLGAHENALALSQPGDRIERRTVDERSDRQGTVCAGHRTPRSS